MFRTSNPALSESVFDEVAQSHAVDTSHVMTVQGTVNKSFIMLVLIVASASFTWRIAAANPQAAMPWIIGGAIAGLILALITIFGKKVATVTAPLYAIAEGLFLGAISSVFNQVYQAIVFQAVVLTFGIFGCMLILYKMRVLQATPKFVTGVVAATGAVLLLYITAWIMRMFDMPMTFLHDSSPLSIGISVVVIIIAALNLILDFALIERGAAQGAPKWMEWYASFALMVTLIWLYIEILHLLAKLQRR